jgi:hypothetical protein
MKTNNIKVCTLYVCDISVTVIQFSPQSQHVGKFLLYSFNSCTSLHFKALKSHTKTLKIRPYMFQSPLKPSSGGPWPYFARLMKWNVNLHL